jgi:flagellar basal body rod protein FlgC
VSVPVSSIGAIPQAYGAARPKALDVASSGMEAAESRADGDASSIATNGPDVGSMVDLDVQKDTYSALATVIRSTDEMTATTVDLLA